MILIMKMFCFIISLMNPLNFEVVTDEIAKQMIPIKETEHSFQDGM